jgi:hypothetical protein
MARLLWDSVFSMVLAQLLGDQRDDDAVFASKTRGLELLITGEQQTHGIRIQRAVLLAFVWDSSRGTLFHHTQASKR